MGLSVRVFFVAMATAIVAAIVSADHAKHQQELKEHYDHLHYIAGFPCAHPQPRVLSVHKLFSHDHLESKAFFPDVTVLHRCDDQSGCCTSGKQCQSQHYDAVELPFKVTFLEDTPKHKKGSWIMEYHIVENHTACACEVPPPHNACATDIVKPTLPEYSSGQASQNQNQEVVGSSYGAEGQYENEAQPAQESSSTGSVDQLITDIF